MYSLLPLISAHARTSNDPWVEQWGYEDTGVYRAWDHTVGSKDVVVAVIDNGFDSGHPDLRDNLWRNEDEIKGNGIDDDNNGYIDDTVGWNFALEDLDDLEDFNGNAFLGNNNPRPQVNDLSDEEKEAHVFSHGTVVAGIIGAVGNNNRDGAGINWNVRLMNVKVLGNDGFGLLTSMPDAIRYAVDNGAHVINISIVGDVHIQELDDALEYAYENDVFVVVAAGNEADDLNSIKKYPVCSDYNSSVGFVLGASAIEEDHTLADFSNQGSDCIDATAPGVDINSTVRYSPTNGLKDTYMFGWQGTSFAAPFFAGAAALIKSVRPDWGAKEIYDAIIKTVHHTPGQDETIYANLFGAGLLQIDKAVEYALSTKPEEVEKKETPVETKLPPTEEPLVEAFKTRKHRILSYQPATGDVEERNVETEKSSRYKRIGLVGIDKVVSYKDEHDEARYAVAKKFDETHREIVLYNEKFAKLHSFVIPASGPVDIAVGDIDERIGTEIAVSPQYDDDQMFRVFTSMGEELYEVSKGAIHGPVSLALSRTLLGGHEVLALYDRGTVMAVEHYNHDDLVHIVEVPEYARGGTIAAGDIDLDGEDEFIIGSGMGQDTALGYYELNGRLISKFFGYNPGHVGGIRAQILDYDMDGADDVLISALDGTKPVRVWNNKVKRLANWYPFGEEFVGDFATISSF